MAKKLIVSLSPHVHGRDSVQRNMYGVCIALIPALLTSLYFFGLGAAIVLATSVAACVFFFGLSQSLSSSRMWQQSVMIGPAETVIEWSMPYMPEWIRALRGTKVTGL